MQRPLPFPNSPAIVTTALITQGDYLYTFHMQTSEGTDMGMSDLRFGVIGWGYWGPKLARNLDALPHSTVTMVADLDSSRLTSITGDRPWMTVSSCPEDVLHANLDGVVIATPVSTHFALAREALLSGKHVLVEKPLTTEVAEAEELIALAERYHRTLMVGHTFVYSPAVNELRKLVQEGDLGNIYCIETERVNLGLFRNDIDVIWDLAPHDLSILLYVLNQQPQNIFVEAHAHLRAAIYDIAHLHLEYSDHMTAHVHVSWLHPSKIRRVTVIGDARMAIYDDTNPAEMLKIFNKGADVYADPQVSYRFGAITIPHIEWAEPLRLECEDFAHAIRTGTPPRATGRDGLMVVRLLVAAQEAIGRRQQQLIMAQSH